ncbi:LCP family protein [Saccharopolyspora rosea]|uniref:LCP family protein n=1 Tax=Saccharopolyspora rosea TaxID=524884 RepID=A0ABW3G007_9PSEU|nr:LCP family protein [Saccharopolyspora rosea]
MLSTTGYGWATLRGFHGSTTASDVLGNTSSEDGAVDILLVGSDSRTDAQGNPLPQEVLDELGAGEADGSRTDTMMLVRIPDGAQRASILTFPRDLQVTAPDGSTEKLTDLTTLVGNATKAKLQKQGVTDPKELDKQSKAAGQKALVQKINEIAGAHIDHFAEVNLLGFSEVTKAIDGVEVCLNHPVHDPMSGANFPAGRQTLQGGQALAFVRQRHGLINELNRGDRQKAFMASLAHKVLSSGTLANPAKLNSLIGAIQRSIVLDPGLADDILGFAQRMQGAAGGDIEFQTIPVHWKGPSGNEVPTYVQSETQQFSADLLLPPAERAKKQQEESRQKQLRAKTSVSVFNASGVSGLAGNVLEQLSGSGFTAGGSSNAQDMPNSLVYYAPGDEEVAKQAAQLLGGLPTKPSQNLKAGQLEVYLGKDYQGPGAHKFGGPDTVRLDALPIGPQVAPLPTQQTDNDRGVNINAGDVPCVD